MKVRDLAIIAILVTLSLILGNIRIFSTVALDSIPAFVALFIYKDYKAGIVAMIGHLLSTALVGFPLGVATHISIAILMLVMLLISSKIVKSNIYLTCAFIYIVNSLLMPFVIFIFIPFSLGLYTIYVINLSIVVVLNLIIAFIIYKTITKVIKFD